MIAECRDDMDIEKQLRNTGQEVLICTYGVKNPTVQVKL